MLVRRKLNSNETLTSKALKNYEIGHEKYHTNINKEEKYRKIVEEIRMMKSRKNDEVNEKGKKNKINKKNKENA